MRPNDAALGGRHPRGARPRSLAMDTGLDGRDGWFPALAGAAAGVALQVLQPRVPSPSVDVALLAGAALAFVGGCFAARGWRHGLGILLAAALAAFACGDWRCRSAAQERLDPRIEGRDVQVTGVVAAMPQRTDTSKRFRFDVTQARDADGPVEVPPGLLLGWWPASETRDPADPLQPAGALSPGDTWRFTVRLKAPHGSVNPHGFDFELWMWEQGLGATGTVRAGPEPPTRVSQGWSRPVERARTAVRDTIVEAVPDRRMAGVIAALVVGDQNAIERADWDVYRATGVAHLMSISGLHITMFAWAAGLAVGRLWRRSSRLCLAWPAQHAALAGGVVLATAYAVFSGWGVPSQRTILMLAVTGLLRLSGRAWPWPSVWLAAFTAVTLADPWALMQAGFWLSFVAVGVLFATDPGARAAPVPARLGRLRASLAAGAREQWVVTVALTPLTLLLFGQVSVVGLVANAFAIPWVTLVVTPLAMAGVFAHPLWQPAALAVRALGAFLDMLAGWPFAVVSLPTAPAWAAGAGVLGGVVLAMRLPLPLRLLGAPLLVPVLAWSVERPVTGEADFLFADIGQGNAVLVRTATHTLVYDAGPRYGPDSDAGHRVLVPLLRSLGESVDLLVLSHRDADHTGGAAAVLASQPGAALLSSIEATHELQAIRRARRCEAGQQWTWDGVHFSILQPRGDDYAGTPKPNAVSCLLRIEARSATALLGGDIEQPQEARLVAGHAPLAADLLLAPHHGSKTSSSEPFLDAVAPRLAVVQAGYRNRFGHPAAKVMARYAGRGIRVVDSPHCGAMRWSTVEPGQVRCARDEDPHPWRHDVP